jgi:hypothetical protein
MEKGRETERDTLLRSRCGREHLQISELRGIVHPLHFLAHRFFAILLATPSPNICL